MAKYANVQIFFSERIKSASKPEDHKNHLQETLGHAFLDQHKLIFTITALEVDEKTPFGISYYTEMSATFSHQLKQSTPLRDELLEICQKVFANTKGIFIDDIDIQ